MSEKERARLQLGCLYDMFRDRVEENVIYIVYSENEGHDFETHNPFPGRAIDKFVYETNGVPLSSVATNSATNVVACRTGGQIHVLDVKNQQHLESISERCQPPTNGSALTKKQLKPAVDLKEQEAAGSICNEKSSEDTTNYDDEDEEGLTIDEKIERLRESIDYWLGERNICHDKATQYLTKKMFPVTSYYSELASQYRRMIETKTRKLLDLLLLKSQDANTIDLHGLNPIQARQLVSDLLKIRQEKLYIDKQGEASIDIITGWGKHTIHSNQHRVKPTIVALLREKGVEYNYLNKGALRVTIRR